MRLTAAGSSRARSTSPKSPRSCSSGTTATAMASRSTVRRAGLNSRTLTPPIDPDELAPDSPGDRGRAAQPGASARQALRSRQRLLDRGLVRRRVYRPDSGSHGDVHRPWRRQRLAWRRAHRGAARARVDRRHAADRPGRHEIRESAREPSPILVGRDNTLTTELVKIGERTSTTCGRAKAWCRSCRARSAARPQRSWRELTPPAPTPPHSTSRGARRMCGTTGAAHRR